MARPKISDLSSIEWGSTIEWEFEFGQTFAPPVPFNKFVPAQSVEFTHINIEEKDIPYGNMTARIPMGSGPTQMTVVFLDDKDDTMLTYFEEWLESLVANGTATLAEAKRSALFYKTDRGNNIGTNPVYMIEIYPTGDLISSVGESAEVRNVSVTFAMVSKALK